MASISLSRFGIQLGAKWQFWKKTHLPRSIALRIIASARGPWNKRLRIKQRTAFASLRIHHQKRGCRTGLTHQARLVNHSCRPGLVRGRWRTSFWKISFLRRTCKGQRPGRCRPTRRILTEWQGRTPWTRPTGCSSGVRWSADPYTEPRSPAWRSSPSQKIAACNEQCTAVLRGSAVNEWNTSTCHVRIRSVCTTHTVSAYVK